MLRYLYTYAGLSIRNRSLCSVYSPNSHNTCTRLTQVTHDISAFGEQKKRKPGSYVASTSTKQKTAAVFTLGVKLHYYNNVVSTAKRKHK